MEKADVRLNRGIYLSIYTRRWLMLVAPIALILSMFIAFQGFVTLLGDPLGYLAAFFVCWTGWCLLLSRAQN